MTSYSPGGSVRTTGVDAAGGVSTIVPSLATTLTTSPQGAALTTRRPDGAATAAVDGAGSIAGAGADTSAEGSGSGASSLGQRPKNAIATAIDARAASA